MEKLNPNARWLFRVQSFFGFLFLLIFLTFWVGGFLGFFFGFLGVFISLLLILVLVVPLTEVYARLAYNNWKYELTDDGLKIEKGIIWKKYTTIPYERIQNVDMQRGIIARIFGFSSINVQTAGAAYGNGSARSEGYLPAVSMDKAEKIREYLTKRVRGKSNKLGL